LFEGNHCLPRVGIRSIAAQNQMQMVGHEAVDENGAGMFFGGGSDESDKSLNDGSLCEQRKSVRDATGEGNPSFAAIRFRRKAMNSFAHCSRGLYARVVFRINFIRTQA
jgi:hypothetical protein